MVKVALLGRDIGCTKLPAVHAAIGQALDTEVQLDAFDTPYDRLGAVVNNLLRDYDGFFVAKPYKSEIKRFIDCAESSVNVVRCADKTAYNTDSKGFIYALDRNFDGWKTRVKSALVLGTGCAAHSVVTALTAAGKKVYVLGRSVINAARLVAKYNNAELFSNQAAELIVNCTPLGANGEDALSAFCVLPSFDYAFDLVCSSYTPFLRRCGSGGAQVADGTDMLIYQAIESNKILLNKSFDEQNVYNHVIAQLHGGGDTVNKCNEVTSRQRKNRYDILLCDADDTVLDFQKAMRTSIVNAARQVGIKAADEKIIKEFREITEIVWRKLEDEGLTRNELDTLRFAMLKERLKEDFDSTAMSAAFMSEMKNTRFLVDGATEFLSAVRARGIKVFIITNGFAHIARERLKALDGYVDGVFISDEIGYNKPDTRFFDYVSGELNITDKSKVLVFGDSVNSDIRGGADSGLDTCLFDPRGNVQCAADYSVKTYDELLKIL